MSDQPQIDREPLKRFTALCGRTFRADPDYFPIVEYRGRTIYLCTDACLGAFLSDPDRFYRTHRESGHLTTS